MHLHQAVTMLVLIAWCDTQARDIEVSSSYDCRKYDLDDSSEFNIIYKGYKSGLDDCEIEIDEDSSYSRICVEAKELEIDDCSTEFEIHFGYVLHSSPDERYTCHSSTWGSEHCTYSDKLTVIIKQHSYSGGDTRVKLRVYPKGSEFDVDFTDIAETAVIGVYVIVGIVIGSIVLIIIIIVIVICCCCKRREASSGTVYRNQQPAPVPASGAYPQVQYTAVSPQAAGYQPPPQGYQPPPQQGLQGYQPQAGYQPPPQGYAAPPPAQGFQMAEMQKMPSAPPPDPMAPPPYPGP